MKVFKIPRMIIYFALALVLTGVYLVGVASAGPVQAPVGAASASEGIFVTGQGEVTIKPDVAYITLGVETQFKTALEAQRENARLSSQVMEKMVSLGVPRQQIQTSNFNLYPVRDYNKTTQTDQVVGYRVTNQVVLTVTQLDQVGPLLDAAVAAGANNIQDINFSVKDVAAAKTEALRLAARDARAKAEALADSLGLSLNGVIALSDQTVSVTPPRALKMAVMDSSSSAAETPITPGDLKIRASVQANFAIR